MHTFHSSGAKHVFVPPPLPPHFFGNTLDKPHFPAWKQKILNKSRDLRLSKYMLRGQCLPSLFCPLYMLALPTLRSTPEASSYLQMLAPHSSPLLHLWITILYMEKKAVNCIILLEKNEIITHKI